MCVYKIYYYHLEEERTVYDYMFKKHLKSSSFSGIIDTSQTSFKTAAQGIFPAPVRRDIYALNDVLNIELL